MGQRRAHPHLGLPYLIEQWSAELAELAAHTSAAAEASSGIRPGWYVHIDDLNTPWAIKLRKSIGEHPLLGFQPLRDPNLAVLPKLVKMRHVYVVSADWRGGRPKRRNLPIATEQHHQALWPLRRAAAPAQLALELQTVDGSTGIWYVDGDFPESGAYNPRVRKRAGT